MYPQVPPMYKIDMSHQLRKKRLSTEHQASDHNDNLFFFPFRENNIMVGLGHLMNIFTTALHWIHFVGEEH